MYNATYDTRVTYNANIPTYSTNFTYHNQILNWTSFADDIRGKAGSASLAYSRQNYISVEEEIEGLLVGSGYPTTFASNYDLTKIQLFGVNDVSVAQTIYPKDFPRQIENLMTNVTLSLRLRDQSIHPSPTQSAEIITATIKAFPRRYSYSKIVLWEAYGIAITCAVACVLVGAFLLAKNGVDANMSFSQILVTTRNDSLDELSAGQNRGGEYISKGLRSTPLMFGEIQTAEGPRVAFGRLDETIVFKK
jgi:hypothetical protein